MKTRVLLGAGALVALATGCGGPPAHDGASAGGAGDEAAAIATHKCTRCHALPERMKHTRAELDTAFGRHRTRVKLTAEQWQSMIDFLGRPDESSSFR